MVGICWQIKNLFFLIAQATLPWRPIFKGQNRRNRAIMAYSPLFVAMAFQNGLQYRHSDFLKVYLLSGYIVCKFGEPRSSNCKFTTVTDVRPVVSFFKINLSDKLSQDRFTGPIFDKFPSCGRYFIADY